MTPHTIDIAIWPVRLTSNCSSPTSRHIHHNTDDSSQPAPNMLPKHVQHSITPSQPPNNTPPDTHMCAYNPQSTARFLAWLLETSRQPADGAASARGFRAATWWCWNTEVPQPATTGEVLHVVMCDGTYLQGWCVLIAFDGGHVLGWQWVRTGKSHGLRYWSGSRPRRWSGSARPCPSAGLPRASNAATSTSSRVSPDT